MVLERFAKPSGCDEQPSGFESPHFRHLKELIMKREMFMDGDGVVQAIETETHIFGLFGKFRALSNFHEEPLIVDGLKFRWSEAAYMAEKTFLAKEKLAIMACDTPAKAKRLGQKLTLRSDWEDVKESKMLKVLRAKFQQSAHCREVLLSTGDKYIEETNWWGDNYWGKCDAHGLNILGKLLMQIREELRKEL